VQRVGGRWLSLGLGVVAACGGRYQSSLDDQPTSDQGGTATSSTGSAGLGSTQASGGATLDVTSACQVQKQSYADYREQLVAKFSVVGCNQDSDCVAFYNQTSCDSSCVLTTTGAKRAVVDGLNNFALSNCSSYCLPDVKQDCGDPPPPHCSDGNCEVLR
jgi:hypothetical protein